MPKKLIFCIFIITPVLLWFSYSDSSLNESVNEPEKNLRVNIQKRNHLPETNKHLRDNEDPLSSQDRVMDNLGVAPLNDIQQTTVNILDQSYMDWYKKYSLARDCYDMDTFLLFNSEKKTNESYKAVLLQNYQYYIKLYSKGRQEKPTQKQMQYYRRYLDQCFDLLEELDIEIDDNLDSFMRQIVAEVMIIMKSVKAITAKEKTLKEVLALKSQLRSVYSDFMDLQKGINAENIERIHELSANLTRYKHLLNSAKFFSDESRSSSEYQKLFTQFNATNDSLAALKVIDITEEENHKNSIMFIVNQLHGHLSTHHPEVFFEAFHALNFNRSVLNFDLDHNLNKIDESLKTIMRQIYEDTRIYDFPYFNGLLPVAVDLYLCHLGEDCSSEEHSTFKRFCYLPIINVHGIFDQACEMGVEEFYMRYFLTANQIEDMNTIFDYLVDQYAE